MNSTETQGMDVASTGQAQATSARKPRTRIDHERSQYVHATNRYLNEIGVEFEPLGLGRFVEFTEDEFAALRQTTGRAVLEVVTGVVRSAPKQDVDAMMSAFEHWCSQRPVIFQRKPEALAAIRQKLIETGGELIPMYALSVGIKLPKSGKLIFVNNLGEECKP